MMRRDSSRTNQEGIALVVTLIILVLLAGLAVGLLQTSGLERGTSKAVADKAKADLMAQTAVNAAIAQLADNLLKYPDSATTWETINGNDGTAVYYRDQTPEAAIASRTPAELYVLPLASGASAQKVANKSSALPTLTDSPASTANAYNFNHARSSGDTQGWIGSSPQWLSTTPSTPQPFRGQWINVTDSDAKVTGRYAFWMEDESFKINANYARDVLRGSNTSGINASEIPLQGLFKLIGLSDPNGVATAAVNFRNSFPSSVFYEFRALNQVNGQPPIADQSKFEATVFSGTSNLSRSGSKRVSLNKVVSNSTDPTEIRKQLDEIINTMTFHLPNFGERFYRTNVSDLNATQVKDDNPTNRTIYLNKIAANIRDYIDSDSQPTIISNDPPNYTVQIGAKPIHSVPSGGATGPNEVIAIGKEAIPVLQEYMLRVKQLAFSSRLGASATYKVEIDHYLEFWNMSTKDIHLADLGKNPFLGFANQFKWDGNLAAGGNDIPEGRSFTVDLTDLTNSNGDAVVFRAGTATVLTTDHDSSNPNAMPLPTTFTGIDSTRIFWPHSAKYDANRIYQGITKGKSGSNLHLDSVPRPNNSSQAGDLETELILGNDDGVLESFGMPNVWYITVNVDDATSPTGAESQRFDTTKYYFRASSLKGNKASATASQTGDPRTNNEQLSLTNSTADEDQTAYKIELQNASVPGSTTITAPNSNFVNPSSWIDQSDDMTNATHADATHAPAVIANAPLNSIGQLGNIFDEVRPIGAAPGSGQIQFSRGGGRTLRIGQPERYDATTNSNGLWDGDSSSASREWTAWRLTDIFSTSDTLQLDGRINLNGVKRDGGVALKTALYGYTFGPVPDSDPNLSGNTFDADPTDTNDKINTLVSQLQTRLDNQAPFDKAIGPLGERGELSELPIFNTGTDLAASVETKNVYDRGREELFRRLVELTTTRGNIFSVYAVGQALTPQAGIPSPFVNSTSQLKVTFRIDPVWNAGTPSEPFDPAQTSRFNKADKYVVKVLYVGE